MKLQAPLHPGACAGDGFLSAGLPARPCRKAGFFHSPNDTHSRP
jgi:hypothetical protein